MTKKLLFVVTIALVATFALMAAGVDGKWVFEQAGRQGGNPTQVTLVLKADGMKLSGSTTRPGRGGDPMVSEIKDGKVDGNNVSFKTTQSMGGNDITIDYTGVVSGDELKLKITRPGRNGGDATTTEVTAKRSTT